MPLCNLKEANVFWFAPESELPILEHPARQPFANAAIAASRVTALPCVGVPAKRWRAAGGGLGVSGSICW